MPTQPIPFVPIQESGNDPLGAAAPLAMNVVMDGKGSVMRRPGIADFEPAGQAISGLGSGAMVGMHTDNRGALFVAQEIAPGSIAKNLHRYDTNLDRSLGVTFYSAGSFSSTQRLQFAETEAMVVIATGMSPQKVVFGGAPEIATALGGSPPDSTHIVAQSSRLVSNDMANRSHIRYSGLAAGSSTTGHETWSATGFVSAEARPDNVLAIHENTDEVFAFGQTNLQVFSPDPSTVYTPSATREIGISAPYSVIKFEQKFAWLDDRRRFVVSDGREFQFLASEAIKGTLDSMSTVADCFGYRVLLGPMDAFIWTFPTANVTLCYQVGGGWSQWGMWNQGTNNWKQFMGTCYSRNPVTHEQYVGTADGVLGVLSFDATSDRSSPEASSATTIPAFVETGALNRGTNARKWCRGVRLALRRGSATSGDAPQGHLQYRDDDGPWSTKIPVRLGAAGETNPVVRFQTGGMGQYRYRQWRLWFDGTEPFTLVRAEEDFEVLEV